MKRILTFSLILLLTAVGLRAEHLEFYRKGKITLKPIPTFGKNTDWDDYFFNPFSEITVPRGCNSIFASNSRQHNFYKFDLQGNFINKFGRKGRGPGDANNPGRLTVLDGKFLVSGDYATLRRITVWDFNGNHVKVLKTNASPLFVTALKDSKIAYLAVKHHADEKNGFYKTSQIIIKDINSGAEKIIQEIKLYDRGSVTLKGGIQCNIGNRAGNIFLKQTINGNLALGISSEPEIKIFSPEGKKLFTFTLKIKKTVVNSAYIKKYREWYMDDLESKDVNEMKELDKFYHDLQLKRFRTLDFSIFFNTHLPYYSEIYIDTTGNFLVLTKTDCLKNCKTFFQVYSPKGEYICETELDFGKLEIEIDYRFMQLCFTKEGIIGYAKEKDDEDEVYRLFKSNY